MLPLHLSIEGLYSYQDKQEIDFTQLTEAGLFGIFGSVGSGKSSILEAISFALYGETERLNKQEKRSYNMLNLKSDNAVIDFQFLNFEGNKYRFVVQWKRKKRFEETTTIERFAYQWKDDAWLPLESADGALITNLSYPNFRRTIIIPQGQFKEFLELKGKDRSDMMKEIFFLNQYDLGPKVSILQAENNRKVEHLKGALSGFEEVSTEILAAKEQEFKEAHHTLGKVKIEYDQIDQLFKALNIAQENRKNLFAKEEELQNLEGQRVHIQQMDQELAQFESVSSNFKEHINNLHSFTASREQLLSKIESLKDNKASIKSKIQQTTQQISEIQSDYDNLERFKKETDDYKLLLLNFDLAQSKQEYLSRMEKGTPILENILNEEQQLTNQLTSTEEELDKLKNNRINTSELLAIEDWFRSTDQFEQKIVEHKKRKQVTQDEILGYKQKIKDTGLNEDNWQDDLQQKQSDLEVQKQLLSDKESALRLKQELSQYILNLHDGEPCPLCGSEAHPTPMHSDDVSAEVTILETQKSRLAVQEAELRKIQNEVISTTRLIQDKEQYIAALEQEQTLLQNQIDSHQERFIWTDFDKNNRAAFESKKAEIQQAEQLISKKENEIKTLRDTLQSTKEKVDKYKKSLDDFKNQVSILDANLNQNRSQLKVLNYNDFQSSSKESLQTASENLAQKIILVDKQYKEWTELVNQSKNLLATIRGQYDEAYEQYLHFNGQLQQIQGKINALLIQFKFADITEVKSILNKNMNVAQLKEKIQQFYIQVSTISSRIEELKEITKEDNYSDKLFNETVELHQLKKQEVELQFAITGALDKELQTLTVELDKKENLLREFDKLNVRKDNLKILDNMFKGNGFVNYVSSIHLERLCEIANQRFHRLTKNQLSLCVNDNNEFEVKDYLNNGYQRSVKTLSGGQGFQASLCLALALAENIQSLNKADKNFFFIDEGFGTQDVESINTVFDTLQYLNQENRVVGIISHVEDLKERMPRSITITKDQEKGSLVHYSN